MKQHRRVGFQNSLTHESVEGSGIPRARGRQSECFAARWNTRTSCEEEADHTLMGKPAGGGDTARNKSRITALCISEAPFDLRRVTVEPASFLDTELPESAGEMLVARVRRARCDVPA